MEMMKKEPKSGHHGGQLVGDPSLKGINQDSLDTTMCLGQSEGHGILIKVTSELVHG